MNRNVRRLLSKITNLWVTIISLGFLIVGSVFFLLTFGTTNAFYGLLGEIGIAFIAIGSLSLVWQLILERLLRNEVYAMVNISDNLLSSGITEVNINFNSIDWESLFNSVNNRIDIFFMTGEGWTKHVRPFLQNVAGKDIKIRLILPDIHDEETLRCLEHRFQTENSSNQLTKDDIKKKITHVKGIYKDIFKDKPANLEIWFYKKQLIFSMYRFDDEIIMALNSHSGESPVPAFRFKGSGSSVYKFLDKELKFLTNESKYINLDKED